MTFYKEWLTLPKNEFRILIMIAESEPFVGNLSDMCRYFSISPQSKNKNKLKTDINSLIEKGIITAELSGRKYTLSSIPKDEENIIKLSRDWIDLKRIRESKFSVSVSFEAVVKVLLFAIEFQNQIVNNEMIEKYLNMSESVITSAKKVIREDFEALHIEYLRSQDTTGIYRCEGQIFTLSAWINQ